VVLAQAGRIISNVASIQEGRTTTSVIAYDRYIFEAYSLRFGKELAIFLSQEAKIVRYKDALWVVLEMC
jgi:hypothetical protein